MISLPLADTGIPLLYILLGSFFLFLFFGFVGFALSRYRRCPSDKILVVYGKVGGGRSAICHHGGAAMVWPILQDFQYLDLTPMPIEINLQGALSKQNIRVNTPSTFTVGISTEPGIMENAAERMLGLNMNEIKELARDIIFGQMRVVIATMDIEEINADRDKLIHNISVGVEVELKKVGLRLINVNVQDITDASGYIDALGQEAASKAINDAKIKVAQADRDGSAGAAEAHRDQRIRVATANASATQGENLAAVEIANSNASRRSAEAEAERSASAAEKVKSAQALQEAYAAERTAEEARAKREEATQVANVIIPAEIEKRRIETMAEAEAERVRREKKGEADGVLSMLQAEAEGQRAILTQKAEGFREMVKAAGDSADLAALLMATEQLPALVAEQVKAISNLKIDKVTVWDSGGENGGSTAKFLRGLVGAVPPLHEVAKNAGVELPEYLGSYSTASSKNNKPSEAAAQKTPESSS
ncbi:MAG: flotillin family protein [Verrucomicrobiales bacterium]